jgi:hypothetical protein
VIDKLEGGINIMIKETELIEGEIIKDKIFDLDRFWVAVYPNVWGHEKESLEGHLKLMCDEIFDSTLGKHVKRWRLEKDYLPKAFKRYKETLMLIQDNDFLIYHEKNGITLRHDSPAWKMPQQRYFPIGSIDFKNF